MTHRFKLLPISLALFSALPALAEDTRLQTIQIDAPALPAPGQPIAVSAEQQARLRAATSDSAQLLGQTPGVSLYQAGGLSSLPAIRGLADDRIRIKLDGMDLIAACPNHMNPVLSYIDPAQIDSLRVYAGITPVSLGGDSIAGTIVANSKPPRFAEPGETAGFSGEAGAHYRSNGNARGANLSLNHASETLAINYTGTLAERDNYKAGKAFRHPAETGRAGHTLDRDEVGSTAYESRNQSLALAWRSERELLELRLSDQQIPEQLWPNQRMDMLDNHQQSANLRYLSRFDWGRLEARAYHEEVEHFMDFGADKRFWYGMGSGGPAALNGQPCSPLGPNCAAGMPMHTESRTDGLLLKGELVLNENDLLRVGGELQRYRLDDWWPASGGGMWPNTFWNIRDGQRDRHALFAELETQWSPAWQTLAGIRYERVDSDAGPVQAYNNTVAPATQLVPAFNQRDRSRSDDNVDLTLLARHTLDETREIEFGLARKTRSPSLYERYSWYSRGMEMLMVNWFGDGNGYIGNMDLKPEKAHTVSASFDWHSPNRRWQLRVSPHYTRVSDYIDALRCPASLGGACATQTAGGGKFVYLQFANQDARLYGLDLSGQMPLLRNGWGEFGLEGVLGYTRGKNLDTGDELYNIMPLNAQLSLTQQLGGWRNALEVVMVQGKNDVSAERNELQTAGYTLLNLRLSHAWKQVRLDFGVENLFDKYYEHPLGGAYLGQGTTMTTTPGGVVPPWGVAVPGMGRSLYAGLNIRF